MRPRTVTTVWQDIVAYCDYCTVRATSGTRLTLRDWRAKNFNQFFKTGLKKSPSRGTTTVKPTTATVGVTEERNQNGK